MSCVLGFGASAAVLAFILRRQFMVWMALRALMVGMLVLTFPPAGAYLFPEAGTFWIARLVATDLAIAVTGPLLATYIEETIDAPRLRRFLWTMLPLGFLLAAATPVLVRSAALYWVHDVAVLGLVTMLVAGLVGGVRAGSRSARFQLLAWTPGLLVGFVTLYFEIVLVRAMPFYAEAMLVAYLAEFVITAAGIGDSSVVVRRERDAAIADVREAMRASTLDPLTGIANRRGLSLRFREAPEGRPMALAVIDCDHFKRINDGFGHDVGDDVLVAVAAALEGEDVFIGRLGGEEFVALIYHRDWKALAEDARRRVTFGVRRHVQQLPFLVTASAGVAQVHEDDTLASAIKRADEALYAAKEAGRNQTLSWPEHADVRDKPETVAAAAV